MVTVMRSPSTHQKSNVLDALMMVAVSSRRTCSTYRGSRKLLPFKDSTKFIALLVYCIG